MRRRGAAKAPFPAAGCPAGLSPRRSPAPEGPPRSRGDIPSCSRFSFLPADPPQRTRRRLPGEVQGPTLPGGPGTGQVPSLAGVPLEVEQLDGPSVRVDDQLQAPGLPGGGLAEPGDAGAALVHRDRGHPGPLGGGRAVVRQDVQEAASVETLRHPAGQEVENRGGHVHPRHRCVDHRRRLARDEDHQGHQKLVVVQLPVAHEGPLSEGLAVVGGDDDRSVPEPPGRLQPVEEVTEDVVGGADPRVVVDGDVLAFLLRQVEAVEVGLAAGPLEVQAAGALVAEEAQVPGRWVVRAVHVVGVDEEEEGPLFQRLDPSPGDDALPHQPPPAADVVVESLGKPEAPRHVAPVREAGGGEAGFSQPGGDGRVWPLLQRRAVVAVRVGGSGSLRQAAGEGLEPDRGEVTGQEGLVGGQGVPRGRSAAVEAHRAGGKGIQARHEGLPVPRRSEAIPP